MTKATQPNTVGEAVREAASLFQSHGVESPRLEAEMLMASVLAVSRAGVLARSADSLAREAAARFGLLVERRLAGEPVHYLTGMRDFMGLDFAVDPRVLIPRSDTEVLAERALEEARKLPRPPRVADIGTGSGAIIVSMAFHLQVRGEYWAVDLSPEALAVARSNARRHGLEEKIVWLEGDLLQPLVDGGVRVDLLLSNPPYIREGEWRQLAREVRDHEPRLALTAGRDGLDCYRRIVAEAPRVLVPGGKLIMEIGHDQGEDLRRLIGEAGWYTDFEIMVDWQGRPRVVLCTLADGEGH